MLWGQMLSYIIALLHDLDKVIKCLELQTSHTGKKKGKEVFSYRFKVINLIKHRKSSGIISDE